MIESLDLEPWQAVIGFGGNIGTDDEIIERFRKARAALAEYGNVWSARLYRTAPIGPEQPPFLNTAVMVKIEKGEPHELVAITREIELQLGRDRRAEERWGPRTIDLDILVWGMRIVRTPDIELPHPRIADRKFVLWPLIEMVSPVAVLPGTNKKLVDLLKDVDDQQIVVVANEW